MALLIDGYNVLHVLGWIDWRGRPRALEAARWRLIRFLSSVLSPAQRSETTVVFDAAGAPPGVPRVLHPEGITVRFAVGYPSADDLLEELIEQASSPRKYVVVSSDRRVQRAALRRQMQAVDCWSWYEGLAPKRSSMSRASVREESRPSWTHWPLSDSEVDRWLRAFYADQADPQNTATNPPAAEDFPGVIENPFPPGYGEDVEDESS